MSDRQQKQVAIVIVAAGSSSRMRTTMRKQYMPLNNGTVLSEAAKAFLETLDCAVLAVAIPQGEEERARQALFTDKHIDALIKDTKLIITQGGATRQESVKKALEAIASQTAFNGIVFIHDAARPFITAEIITRVARAAIEHNAAVPAIPATDTQKIVDKNNIISKHLRRASMVAVQTPQAFDFLRILKAHKKAENDGNSYTDDTEIWDVYEGRVAVVSGDISNKKITYTGDILKNTCDAKKALPHIASGIGYDIHRLVTGRKLLIGGITLPFDKGEDGHSDGDVLFHAITDALLGASALGDIGSLFPNDDATWQNEDSAKLLKIAWQKISANGWRIGNLDCIVKLESPKFLPYRNLVRNSIATALNTDYERIFVKAKTGEKLGDVGAGLAIEAWCTCLLIREE